MTPPQPELDWSEWSRDAVRLMQERNDAWMEKYQLQGSRYQWSFEAAQLMFRSESGDVVADVCVLGSISQAEGTFLWAWANEAIPLHARRGLESVRAFGERNTLELLTRPECPGARSEGLELAAIAAKVLDAAGLWSEPAGDVTLFFALFSFRKRREQQ